MGFIVPILRALFVFSNTFETFKTLKLPPPSTRNGGKPTVRAMSQRKRAMKGCMTVWLVWCCYATYEKTIDGIVGMFIPFYNEMKALVLLFFILTRARGTEPVYLHILRPMVKPYAGPLDSLVDLTETFGDLVVLLCAIPYHILSSTYHRFISRRRPEPTIKDEPVPTPQMEPEAPLSQDAEEHRTPQVSAFGAARTRRRPLQDAQTRARVSHTANGTAATNGHKPVATKSAHEIWYPPPPAYDESPPTEPAGLTAPAATGPAIDMSVDEWRQYEAFPAAYPPTPLPRRVQLAMPDATAPPLIGIQEEQSYYYSYIADDSIQVEEQGFQESLRLPRENPRSAGDLSDDDIHASGVASEDEMNCEEDDDDFDITLRTPALKRVQNMSNATSSSIDRDSNISTEFSTVDGGSPLRTRTNSEASTMSGSDASSVAGRKRPISSVQESFSIRPPLKDRLGSSQTVRQRHSSTHMTVRPPSAISRTRTSTSASGAENRETGEDAAKRRRVGTKEESKKEAIPTRKQTVRLGTETGVKDTVVRKASSLTAVPRNTQIRAPTRISRRTDSSRTTAK